MICYTSIVDSVPYDKLCKALKKTSLVNGIKKASPIAQTSCLEGFHSVVNQFAPKMIHYSFSGMYCRLVLLSFTLRGWKWFKAKLYWTIRWTLQTASEDIHTYKNCEHFQNSRLHFSMSLSTIYHFWICTRQVLYCFCKSYYKCMFCI